MNTPHVMFVVGNGRWTGAAQPAVDLARQLADDGARVLVCGGRGHLSREVEARGLLYAPIFGAKCNLATMPRDLPALRRLLRDQQPHVIHAVLSAAHWLTGLAGGPAIRIAHNFQARPLRHDPLSRRLYRRGFHGLIEVAESVGRVDRRNLGLEEYRVMPWPGAVDAARFERPDAGRRLRTAIGAGDETLLLGMVARMQPKRRYETFIDAVAAARDRLPGFRLCLVGKGEHRPALARRVEQAGLSQHVVWSNDLDLPFEDRVAGLDLMVYPAEGSDGSARTVLEAMAAGVPVVAAPRPALIEMIEHDTNGLLVDVEDTATLANVLVSLAHDPARRARLASDAQRRVLARHTWPRLAERIRAFHARLMQR